MSNNLDERAKHSMVTRILTSLVLLVFVVPAAIFGGFYYFFLIAAIGVIAIFEFVHTPRNENRYGLFVYLVIYVITLSFTYWVFFKDKRIYEQIINNQIFRMYTISISTMGITSLLLVLMLFSIIYSQINVKDVTYLFTMSVFVGIGLQSMYFLRYFPKNQESLDSCLFAFYVATGTFMSDVGAYFVGVLFGKHKMNEKISPKKTWEGFAGGVAFSIVASLTFAFVCDLINHPILPFLNIDHWYWVLLISSIMPITANIGDFLFSAIKRSYAIKDFSHVFPGHGGVLDRIDSLLVTSLIVGILVVLISNNWNFMI